MGDRQWGTDHGFHEKYGPNRGLSPISLVYRDLLIGKSLPDNPHITRITDWGGRTFRYTYTNDNLVRANSPLAVAGKIDSTTYDYYTTTDGTSLDHSSTAFDHDHTMHWAICRPPFIPIKTLETLL